MQKLKKKLLENKVDFIKVYFLEMTISQTKIGFKPNALPSNATTLISRMFQQKS